MQKLSIIIITLLLTACAEFPGVYKVDIEQGNIVTQDMMDQLAVGQTKAQVQFILGSPLIEDSFSSNRWDYSYRVKSNDSFTKSSNLIVLFNGDVLSSFSVDDIIHQR